MNANANTNLTPRGTTNFTTIIFNQMTAAARGERIVNFLLSTIKMRKNISLHCLFLLICNIMSTTVALCHQQQPSHSPIIHQHTYIHKHT